MKKHKNKLILISNIIIIMFCITISFAWMDDMVGYKTNRFITMIFGKDIFGNQSNTHLFVAPNSIDVDLYVEENDGYKLISGPDYTQNLYSKNNLGPDDIVRYNMVITNKTLVDANVSIMLTNILTNYEKLYEYVYIGIISSKGFVYPYEPPKIGNDDSVNEFRLSDNIMEGGFDDGMGDTSTKKAANLVDNVVIPCATFDKETEITTYQPVEIRFYIRIDHTAKNDIQNKFLKIENMSFMVA